MTDPSNKAVSKLEEELTAVTDSKSDTQTITIKANQKYWLSPEAKEKRKAYMKSYHKRKREELDTELKRLSSQQFREHVVSFTLFNDQERRRIIRNDDDLVRFLTDLLETLQENSIIKDFSLK